MKYMGSKRAMLDNGLGETIIKLARKRTRVVDLFTGSGALAWFAAEQTKRAVVAVDLQLYAVALARAVVERTNPIDWQVVRDDWHGRATLRVRRLRRAKSAATRSETPMTRRGLSEARRLCSSASGGAVWRAYGGYYFSPMQALILDELFAALPSGDARSACLAALIMTASKCAAAPGHTAQPFGPTEGGLASISEAWQRDPLTISGGMLARIAPQYASVMGRAYVADAVATAETLGESDLVVIDPPYSSVQYSRFYHVLETIAAGHCGPTTGAGRYPAKARRPRSRFSLIRTSSLEAEQLLRNLASAGCTVILTFPRARSSNGLTGQDWLDVAGRWFKCEATLVSGEFSTLGGSIKNGHRAPRHASNELIVQMHPR